MGKRGKEAIHKRYKKRPNLEEKHNLTNNPKHTNEDKNTTFYSSIWYVILKA